MWLGRTHAGYELFDTKPVYNKHELWHYLQFSGAQYLHTFCREMFERHTGIKLRVGQCVEVELRVKRKGKAR